jgi:hypothetical protein
MAMVSISTIGPNLSKSTPGIYHDADPSVIVFAERSGQIWSHEHRDRRLLWGRNRMVFESRETGDLPSSCRHQQNGDA